MKRGIKSLLVLAVFTLFGMLLVGGVSAGSCGDDDTIMKLYSSENSHGALWDDTNYTYDICCEDIFGVGAQECNGVHTCTGNNKVLGLYSASNSHAEIPSLDVYTNDVCYGNLLCESDTSAGNTCTNGGEIVIRLYQNTNSHISNASDTNYGVKICCKAGAEITAAYWADMADDSTVITTADLNDKVQLRVTGEGMETKVINYEIWKSVRFWFDDKVADTDTTGFITWRASEAGTYYFIADVEGVSMQSGDLDVSSTEDNSPPYVEILGPGKGEIYSVGESISFSEEDYDEDDEVSILWDFGDGTTSTDSSPTHSYDTPGQYIVTKTVTDERGSVSEDKISILIINVSVGADAEYVFAYIDEPEWGEFILGRVISFNATSTYAIETTGCDGTSCTINCLSGGCPLETYAGGTLISAGNRGDYNVLNFSWTFDDGSWKNGMGLVEFDWTFRTAGKHKAWLTVSKNPLSSIEVEFSSYFDYPYCYRDKITDNTFWYEGGSVVLSLEDCYRVPALNPKPTEECCPPSYACNTGSGICELLEGIASCGQYSEDKCGTNNFVAEDELNPILAKDGLKCGGSKEYGTECWEIIDCKCEWNSTQSKCLSVAEHVVANASNEWYMDDLPATIKTICGDTELPFSGECSFDFILTDKCDTDGWIERTWSAIWSPSVVTQEELEPAYCEPGSDQINCKMTKLTFFTIVTLIVTILIIILIYWFMIKKEKKKGKEKKKK